jgi:hypothetical protein
MLSRRIFGGLSPFNISEEGNILEASYLQKMSISVHLYKYSHRYEINTLDVNISEENISFRYVLE